MKELSLFSGAGGGLLGTKLLGWNHIGYVEYNDYCQRVIRQRIIDGILDNAPIFGDIRTFISSGCASLYRGVTDVITAGFPCQPFSNAGKRLGADDERNMWPATIECIRLVRPRYALLENVPGLLTSGYFGNILSDLAESGYDARWDVLSASPFVDQKDGARLWIVVSSHGARLERLHQAGRGKHLQPVEEIIPRDKRKASPRIYRGGDGLADRVERTKAIGNGQVPICAAVAFLLLAGGES